MTWKACKAEYALEGEEVALPPVGMHVLTQQRVSPDAVAELKIVEVLTTSKTPDTAESRAALLVAFPQLKGVPTKLVRPSAIVSMWRKSDTAAHDGWASDAFPMHVERLPTHWTGIPAELE